MLPIAFALLASCGSERPSATEGNRENVAPAFCATPNEGCDCDDPGQVVECGTVRHDGGDYVTCAMGKRTCAGGKWGACVAETDVKVRTIVPTAGVGTGTIGARALGTGQPCPAPPDPLANPCDPYCHHVVDDATGLPVDGGFAVVDGGLTIQPTADGGALGGGSPFISTSSGVSACSPTARNVVASSCTPGAPSALTACQQDHRCDAITSTCLWNGGNGYFDRTAGGVDLTIGAPCGPSGSAPSTAPVCNRGTVPVPAGSPIQIWQTNGPSPPDGCSNLGPPTFSFTLSTDLDPGQCTSFQIANSPGAKFVTVNAGSPGAVAEAPGRCANNSAYWRTDGAPDCAACTTCNTTVTGRVYDPSGFGAGANNLPLAGVAVFQPAGSLTPFVDGVSCDTCDSLKSPAQTETVTGDDGSFTLSNVSPGTSVPIVVQSGRWRRMVTIPVTGCQANAPAEGTFRMPRNRTEGDIPKIALVQERGDPLECLMRKIGIDLSEIQRRTGPGDAHRIQIYRDTGMNTSPAAPLVNTLYQAGGSLNEYSALILGCAFQRPATIKTSTAADRTRLKDWVDAGGRVFTTHDGGDTLIRNAPAPFNTVATWNILSDPVKPGQGKVLLGSPPRQRFHDWLVNVGASTDYGSGWVRLDNPKRHAMSVGPNGTEWIRGETKNNWAGNPGGSYTATFSFEAPVGAATTCGRVIYNTFHTAPFRVTGGVPISGKTFPTHCQLGAALSPGEKALEYHFFQATACALGGNPPPPPPPPPPPLPVVTFVRDYEGVCGVGERVKWGPFYWQAGIPAGTSIEFRAATAETQAGLPPEPPGPAPTTVPIGTAGTTALAPTWDCNGCPGGPVSVDHQLRNAPPGPGTLSKSWLRVFMRFQPVGATGPTLYSWRQIYNCVPAE